MLTLAFFGAVFSSVLWMVYALRFVVSSLSGMSFFDAGITNVLLYVLFVCLPVFLLWTVFGFISQYANNRATGRQMHRLFSQMKKNQEYSDLLARIMLETEQNIKNSFVLNRFDLFVSDMNELLSEFILRERLVSAEQNEHLWIKVQNGGKWSFGKVLIENFNQQPSFQKKIFNDALSDHILSGTVLEFCARYQTLVSLLEKHDKERAFLNIIETGVFGKVFTILAPVADEIRRSREVWNSSETAKQPLNEPVTPTKNIPLGTPDVNAMPQNKVSTTSKINQFLGKFMPSAKETAVSENTKDPFSLALERSFSETPQVKEEPVFETDTAEEMPLAPSIPLTEETVVEESFPQISDTDKTLDNLRKEWKAMGTSAQEENGEDLAYPFGGWTDAENYQK